MAGPEAFRYQNLAIAEAAGSVVARLTLPPIFAVLIHDQRTSERLFALVAVEKTENAEGVVTDVQVLRIGSVPPELGTTDVVDRVMEELPNASFVCDQEIADELSKHSCSFIEEGHYRLEGRPGGVLDVYTPYKAHKEPSVNLPDESSSTYRYVFEE